MFHLGWPEMLLIAGGVLILFGPSRLPDMARSLGKGIVEFKKGLKEPEEGAQKGSPKTKGASTE